jgi:hypothetical protein
LFVGNFRLVIIVQGLVFKLFEMFGWNMEKGPLGKWSHKYELIKYKVNMILGMRGKVMCGQRGSISGR